MNWYRKFLLASIQGEYWIQSGHVIGADTNINDMGHEGEAIASAQYEIMDSEEDWEEWKANAAREEFDAEMQVASTPQQKQQIQNKWNADGGEEFLMQALRKRNVDNETYQMAEGMGDVRKYAMKKWGWKRLQGDNVETWGLTQSDLSEIANGIWDAYGDEAEMETFNIYCFTTNKWYNNIPFEVISSEDPIMVARYQER